MPAEGRENPLLKKGNSDAFFREKYLTKNNRIQAPDSGSAARRSPVKHLCKTEIIKIIACPLMQI